VSDQPLLSEPDARAYRLLQADLVATRNLLDRQVRQLTRLNALSTRLDRSEADSSTSEAFAEAILDVLDTGFGAVWVLEEAGPDAAGFHAVGAPVPEPGWSSAAAAVARLVHGPRARSLRELPTGMLRGVDLYDVMVCGAVDRVGRTVAVLLAAHTAATTGMDDPPGAETLEVLGLLAERCATYIDARRDWALISGQMGQLQASEQRLDRVLRGTNDGWWDWDTRGGRCTLSARWFEMLGHPDPRTTTVDGFWHASVHEDDRAGFLDRLDEALARGPDTLTAELRLVRLDGTALPVLLRGTVSRDERGAVTRFAGSVLDLTERKRLEEDVQRMAYIDALTDLPNRRLLLDRLAESIRRSAATGVRCGLLMVDLDHLKALNDHRGHAAGDELLREVARRLRGAVRTTDTVARLGGDEFVILLDAMPSSEGHARELAASLAGDVLAALDEPYALTAGVHRTTASIGVAVSTRDATTPEVLLHRADVAMYEAKSGGRARVEVYGTELESRAGQRASIQDRLARQFAEDRIRLGYRAVLDADGAVAGVDALMRWDDGSEITVSELTAVAGRNDLIASLGRWAVTEVAEEVAGWTSGNRDGVRVSVRVPAHHVLYPRFVDSLADALDSVGGGLERIRVNVLAEEVTEVRAALADRMAEQSDRGLRFSLLGFGAGSCSLMDLQALPVDEVRVPAALLAADGGRAPVVAAAVLDLCAGLGVRVVAEGVDDPASRAALHDRGVRYVQGDAVAPWVDSLVELSA
jgi:diguanylate cyclase (GGDEF)-like protein/PAS domain S-box-containing protein